MITLGEEQRRLEKDSERPVPNINFDANSNASPLLERSNSSESNLKPQEIVSAVKDEKVFRPIILPNLEMGYIGAVVDRSHSLKKDEVAVRVINVEDSNSEAFSQG